MALLDLDQVAIGPAAADVASVLAGFRYRRLVGELGAGAERAHAEAVLGGYADAGGALEREALRWHMAAALLAERALRAITRARPGGLAHLSEVLAGAHSALVPAGEVAA